MWESRQSVRLAGPHRNRPRESAAGAGGPGPAEPRQPPVPRGSAVVTLLSPHCPFFSEGRLGRGGPRGPRAADPAGVRPATSLSPRVPGTPVRGVRFEPLARPWPWYCLGGARRGQPLLHKSSQSGRPLPLRAEKGIPGA